jgi:hypothetical protein
MEGKKSPGQAAVTATVLWAMLTGAILFEFLCNKHIMELTS